MSVVNNQYIWRGPKVLKGKSQEQEEINLLTCSQEKLDQCLDHCNIMLFNSDKYKPGRKVLYNIVKEQIKKCTVSIYIKEKQKTESIMTIVSTLKGLNPDTPLKEFIEVDPLFQDLTVSEVLDGALDKLGIFIKNHITLTGLLYRKGIKISNEDYIKLFKDKTKDEIVDHYKENLNIPLDVKVRTSPNGLSSDEIREIMEIRNCKYSDLTKSQLVLLKDKILPDLLSEIQKHINFWEVKAEIIKYIQKDKGYIK